ncbi:cytidylate kinase-like family protein [Desulfococcaceae bacterium HSG7]|nr:cytidylate kinase-like family protein [Desulfococcaceae bacterium HSG7]
MELPSNSIENFMKEQLARWKEAKSNRDKNIEGYKPVITISSEPGSSGESKLAPGLARELEFDLFKRDVIKEISESAHISAKVLETIGKDRRADVAEHIATVIADRYLWPGLYLEHLMKVIGTIGKHGRAVIVGHGANFIIPPAERLSVRVIAPLNTRVQNVTRTLKMHQTDAQRRVLNHESEHRAFIRQSFNADASNPNNYDIVINTHGLDIEIAIDAISNFWDSNYKKYNKTWLPDSK